MLVSDYRLVAVLFELKFQPRGLHRAVFHHQDFNGNLHGLIRPPDVRATNERLAYKRRGAVASRIT